MQIFIDTFVAFVNKRISLPLFSDNSRYHFPYTWYILTKMKKDPFKKLRFGSYFPGVYVISYSCGYVLWN